MRERSQQRAPDLETISRRHPREIYRLVRRFVDDPEEALDIAQEALVQAFMRRETFRSESAFTTWLYRIALNLCHDQRRRAARRKAREVLASGALEIESPSPGPLDRIVAREHSERIEHLLDALTPHQYVVIVLHYYAGLPQKQVSEVVGASLSAVQSRLRRARASLEQWLTEDQPPSPTPDPGGRRFLTVGRILLGLRDYEAALPYCKKAATLMPDDVNALCALGSACFRTNNLEGAWEMAQRALRIDPDWSEAHNLCGIGHGLRGEHEEALVAFRRAAADTRADAHAQARAYCNLGTTFVFMKRPQDAVEPFEQAIALDPEYATPHSHLGNIHLDEERLEEALRCQDRATALDPPYFQGHFNRGAVLEAMGRIGEAIAAYRRASELAPWWIDAHAAMGLLLHAQGRHEEAEAQFRTALSIRGGGGYGAYFRGRAHLALGDGENAFAEFKQAARESPEFAEPLLWLSRLHEERGDLSAARQAVRDALEREPANKETQERLRALEE